MQPRIFQACTSTSCTVFVSFGGMAGQYTVSVTNPANQLSNQLAFSVQPYPPPSVTGVANAAGTAAPVATANPQVLAISGANFTPPETVNLYYNGVQIATFSSSTPGQVQALDAQSIEIDFNFQGEAGQDAVEVTGPTGSSGLFNFTVAAP